MQDRYLFVKKIQWHTDKKQYLKFVIRDNS